MEIKILKKILGRVARLQVARPYAVLAAIIVFTVLIMPGLAFIRFDTSNENVLPENDPMVESLWIVGTEFEGMNTVTLLFLLDAHGERDIVDLRDPLFLKKADQLVKSMEALNYVDEVDCAMGLIKEANKGVLPEDVGGVKGVISKNPAIDRYFNGDYSMLKCSLASSSGFGDNEEGFRQVYYELLAEIDSVGLPQGVEGKIWGDIVQFIEMESSMGETLLFSTVFAFAIVFVIIILFYRSVVSGVLAIFPIGFAVLWAIGAMGYIDLPFTFLTTGFIPIVMGLGIDFSIHLIHGIERLRRGGTEIDEAIIKTMEEVGEAIFGSTVTTAIGFFSLVLASLLITQRLGITLTLSIIAIFLACILMIPPVLKIRERFIRKSK